MPGNLRVLAITTSALLMLSGCGKGAPPPAGKTAGAQVLPGTISDAMINLDQSQSQPLLQPVQRTRTTASEIMGDNASDASDDPAAPDAAQSASPAPDKPKAAPAE